MMKSITMNSSFKGKRRKHGLENVKFQGTLLKKSKDFLQKKWTFLNLDFDVCKRGKEQVHLHQKNSLIDCESTQKKNDESIELEQKQGKKEWIPSLARVEITRKGTFGELERRRRRILEHIIYARHDHRKTPSESPFFPLCAGERDGGINPLHSSSQQGSTLMMNPVWIHCGMLIILIAFWLNPITENTKKSSKTQADSSKGTVSNRGFTLENSRFPSESSDPWLTENPKNNAQNHYFRWRFSVNKNSVWIQRSLTEVCARKLSEKSKFSTKFRQNLFCVREKSLKSKWLEAWKKLKKSISHVLAKKFWINSSITKQKTWIRKPFPDISTRFLVTAIQSWVESRCSPSVALTSTS